SKKFVAWASGVVAQKKMSHIHYSIQHNTTKFVQQHTGQDWKCAYTEAGGVAHDQPTEGEFGQNDCGINFFLCPEAGSFLPERLSPGIGIPATTAILSGYAILFSIVKSHGKSLAYDYKI
ncbi:hypothetical protein ACJX0J_031925, partial [Zea mays]